MKKFIFIKWQDFKIWFGKQLPFLKYETKSVLQTFISAVALFLVGNWATIVHTSFSTDTIVALITALARSGTKAVWVFVEPQILSSLKKISTWKKDN